jgi:hypothetical protein
MEDISLMQLRQSKAQQPSRDNLTTTQLTVVLLQQPTNCMVGLL